MKIYRKAQNKILYVMRGTSGSGKSTKAKSLPGVTEDNIFEPDKLIADNLQDYNAFFEGMDVTNNWSPLAKIHNRVHELLEQAMQEGRTPLVLDDMNLKAWNCKHGVEAAIRNGYEVNFIDVGTGGLSVDELTERNRHGVNRDRMQELVDRYHAEGPLTIEKVLESEVPDMDSDEIR